jgi:hypothetical protein
VTIVGLFKLLRWAQHLHQSTWDHKILYADTSLEDEQLLIRPLLRESKNINMAGGSKLKFTFYFIQRTHKPLHLSQIKFYTLKDNGHTYKFYFNHPFINGTFEYSVFWNFEVMLGQTLNYFVQYCVILCSVIYLYDIYLVIVLSNVIWLLEYQHDPQKILEVI